MGGLIVTFKKIVKSKSSKFLWEGNHTYFFYSEKVKKKPISITEKNKTKGEFGSFEANQLLLFVLL